MNVDIFFITYKRPAYTKLSLERLLETCRGGDRVWGWHNGSDEETLEIVKSFKEHPAFHKLHHSVENVGLREPTNWFWQNSDATLLAKVDDDCLVPHGWLETLSKAHEDAPELGVVGCWHFHKDDFDPQTGGKKIITVTGGHQILQNCWLGGSGIVFKRESVEAFGNSIGQKEVMTSFHIDMARRGKINGWYYPLLLMDHMDDPRSPHSLLKTDADLEKFLPLSAKNNGVTSLEAWLAQLKRSAHLVQTASTDPKMYTGWQRKVKALKMRVKRLFGNKVQW